MIDNRKNTSEFLIERQKLFDNINLIKSSLSFSIQYSLLVEEYIIKLVHMQKVNCVLAAVGSFGRRELSPYSNIDLMFIVTEIKTHENEIQNCVNKLKHAGIDISFTIREFSDIKKIKTGDVQFFTHFFETRFIYGNKEIFDKWKKHFFYEVQKSNKEKLINNLIDEIKIRHSKYGTSPKVLEPNIKYSAGGLRDIHAIEWMYAIENNYIFPQQDEITQTERFLEILCSEQQISKATKKELLDSYGFLLATRNTLHLTEKQRKDRLEFYNQQKIALQLGYNKENWQNFMIKYFKSATAINRFAKTMIKKYKQEFAPPLSDFLSIQLDDDFFIKGKIISFTGNRIFTISEIMRAFYYRASNNATFEKSLRSRIIETVNVFENYEQTEIQSSVFFREILKLPSNVGKTLSLMNEFGFLGIFLKEFDDLIGFFQQGIYHIYTTDEHTLIAIQNTENLHNQNSDFAKVFQALPSKDILYMAILLHDIAKPISLEGHEIIGAEISNSIMERLGYSEKDIRLVEFLVKHHLVMEQTAFRRDLNDPVTLDEFVKIFSSVEMLDLLYLLTFADLSAVNPAVWTQWKESLLNELYRKAKEMLIKELSGSELISIKSLKTLETINSSLDKSTLEHLELVDDPSYSFYFPQEEINKHIDEIKKGSKISVFINRMETFTNITVITQANKLSLSNICATLTINNLEIHDAKIFTRKDGIIINSFSVTDFTTHESIKKTKAENVKNLLLKIINNEIDIENEISKIITRRERLEHASVKNNKNVKVNFKKHKNFTIIEIYSPDRIGLLYKITQTLNRLNLKISFAKIATRVDNIIDIFYVTKINGTTISDNEYEFIKTEITETIYQFL